MGTEIDYSAVLADLEAKRAAIDNTIAGIRQMLNLGAEQGVSGTATQAAERRDQPTSVRFDSFFQMSLPTAIKKFLEIAKAPQAVSDITRALLEGGFKTTSKNLMPIVGSNLSRMKSGGEVVNIDGKWGLALWYPAARMQPAKPAKRKLRKQQKRSIANPPSGNQAQKAPAPSVKPGSSKPTAEQIERIKELQAEGKKPGEIAKEIGLHHLAVWSILKQQQAA